MENLETFGLFLRGKDYQSYKLYGSQRNGYSIYIDNQKISVSDADAARAKNGYVYFDGEVVEPKIVHLSMDEIASILGVGRAEAFARGIKTPLFDRDSNASIIDKIEATIEMIGEKTTEFLLIERFATFSRFRHRILEKRKALHRLCCKRQRKKRTRAL